MARSTLHSMAAILLAAAPAAAAPAATTRASVKYLATEAQVRPDRSVVLRGAFEITGPPHAWYAVRFHLLRAADKPLLGEGSKPLVVSWHDLFTPQNVRTARWTDCRKVLPFAELRGRLPDLPPGGPTVVYVACAVHSRADEARLGDPWAARTPLVLTADAIGRLDNVETFNTNPLALERAHRTARIKGKACRLKLRYLALKRDVRLYAVYGLKGEARLRLIREGRLGYLSGDGRGDFFAPIDSAEEAKELAALPFGGDTVIKTAKQYAAIVAAAKRLGWEKGAYMPVTKPPAFGMTVTEIPPLGYRVRMLTLEAAGELVGSVYCRQINITSDGRMKTAETLCLQAPYSGTSAPPGWTQPLPAGPKRYSEAVRTVLTAEGAERVPQYVEVTDRTMTIPCAADDDPRWFRDPDAQQLPNSE
jgi:hypothetical protein